MFRAKQATYKQHKIIALASVSLIGKQIFLSQIICMLRKDTFLIIFVAWKEMPNYEHRRIAMLKHRNVCIYVAEVQ